MIYSFDVFDTCIVRSCGKPDNIFRLLAEEVVQDKDESRLRAFVIERKNAEKTAILSLGKEAVTLNEIYDVFDLSLFTNMPKAQIKELEIALELCSFAPIKRTIEKINSLRSKGRILFISDMYLPDKVIQEGLTSLGIMQEGDCLYVSGSIGFSKYSGQLFDYVAQMEDIKNSVWVHHGDNLHSDYFMPRRKGIKARLVCSGYSTYETLIENEAKFFSSSLAASVFAGLMRAERLRGRSDDGGFVANIMAPLLVPFVDALLKDATAKHIRRLYFASRDTYVMYLVAKEFSLQYKDLEIHYLHISTKSVYPSSIYRADKLELSHILEHIGRFSPYKIMQMFGFTDEEISDMRHWFRLDEELCYGSIQANAFMEKLLESGNRAKLQTRCAAKRKLLIDYLQQEGFCGDDHVPVGLVDVGWRCSTQEILQKITDVPVRYYYWGVSSMRVRIGLSGPFISFYYAEDFGKVHGNNKFIEYYICRNCEGTTLGYKLADNGIEPILGERKNTLMDEEIHQNHETIQHFVHQYRQYKCLSEHSKELFHSLFLKVMYHFMQYPNKDMVVFLSKYLRWGNFFEKKMPVIIKLYPWTMTYIVVTYCLKNVSNHVFKYRAIC